MRIIVTGGAGFLGSHLCEALLRLGHTVISVDNYSTGRIENIEHMIGRHRFQHISHDVEYAFWGEWRADRIYNLASPASPPQYQRDPIRTMRTNVIGALNALDLARRNDARILQASTSEVYGDPEVHPQPEWYWGNVNPRGVRACYDEGKRAAEAIFFDHRRMYGTDIRVARIFNTYGPKMDADDGRVVSNFIGQALRGDDLTVYGDGSQTRSFCYVADMVSGLIALMEAPDAHSDPVNLGSDAELSIMDCARLVIELTGSTSEIRVLPLPEDDPVRRRPDLTRARRVLPDWSAGTSLRDGLERTIAHWRDLEPA